MLTRFDARKVVIHYSTKGERVDQVLQDIVLDHVNRLEQEKMQLQQQIQSKNTALAKVIDACYGIETNFEIAEIARGALKTPESNR